jgi:hypothetical protein
MVSAGAVSRSSQPDRTGPPEAVPHRVHTNPSLASAERTSDAQQDFKSARTNEPEPC